MTKEGEINFIRLVGKEGVIHDLNKPFSSANCADYLVAIGVIMSLLPTPPATLLDLGCGLGWTSRFFARRGYQVTGVDISPDVIRYANTSRANGSSDNPRFIVCDYEDMDSNSEFDCAVFYDSLHHSTDETAALRAVYRALKPGGICITHEPGVGHAKGAATIEAVRKYNVTERDMPPGKIIKAGKDAGFSKFKTYPHAIHLNKIIYGEPNRRLLKLATKSGLLRALSAIFLVAFYKQFSGIVILIK